MATKTKHLRNSCFVLDGKAVEKPIWLQTEVSVFSDDTDGETESDTDIEIEMDEQKAKQQRKKQAVESSPRNAKVISSRSSLVVYRSSNKGFKSP